MEILSRQNNNGFTLVEIIVVFLLMGIIAATVLGRSIGTSDIDLTTQFERTKNLFRYAQSAAMKYETEIKINAFWGVHYDMHNNRFWLFRGNNPLDDTNQIRFPAEEDIKIKLSDRGVVFTKPSGDFTLYFDKYGRPHYPNTSTPISSNLNVEIDVGGLRNNFDVTAETGLIQ